MRQEWPGKVLSSAKITLHGCVIFADEMHNIIITVLM